MHFGAVSVAMRPKGTNTLYLKNGPFPPGQRSWFSDQATDWVIVVRFPKRAKMFSPLHRVQTDSVAYLPS